MIQTKNKISLAVDIHLPSYITHSLFSLCNLLDLWTFWICWNSVSVKHHELNRWIRVQGIDSHTACMYLIFHSLHYPNGLHLTKHKFKDKIIKNFNDKCCPFQWQQRIEPSMQPFWAQGHVRRHKLHTHEANLGRRRWEVTQIPNWEHCCSLFLIKQITHLQQKSFSSLHFSPIGVFFSINQVSLCEKSTTSWWWCHNFEERIHLLISSGSAEALGRSPDLGNEASV